MARPGHTGGIKGHRPGPPPGLKCVDATPSPRPPSASHSGLHSPPYQGGPGKPRDLQGRGKAPRPDPSGGRTRRTAVFGARGEMRAEVNGLAVTQAGPSLPATLGPQPKPESCGRPRRPGPRGWQGAEERGEAQAGTTHLGQQAEGARLALTLQQRRELLGGSLGEAEALERQFSPRDPEGKSQAPAAARAALSVTPPVAPSLPVSPPPEPLPSAASLVLRVGVLVGPSLLGSRARLQSCPRSPAAEQRPGGLPAQSAAWPPPLRRYDVLQEVELRGGDVSLP